jgi:hypothetical protein
VQVLNRLVDLDEILYGGDTTEGDLDTIFIIIVASTIPQWRTFKLLRWMHLLNRLVDLDEIFIVVTSIIPKWLSVCPH